MPEWWRKPEARTPRLARREDGSEMRDNVFMFPIGDGDGNTTFLPMNRETRRKNGFRVNFKRGSQARRSRAALKKRYGS